MRSGSTGCALVVFGALVLVGCDLDERLGGLRAACGEERIDEVMVQDAPSEACRAWLEDHALPEVEGVGKDVFVAGIEADDTGKVDVLVSGVGESGDALTDRDWAEAEVLWHAEADASDAGTPAEVERRVAFDDGLVHLAFVLDYSSSMREGELRAQAALMASLLRGFPGTRWGKVVFFTESVQPRLALTDDLADVEAALAHDAEAPRGSTALWDAVAEAAEALGAGNAPIRLLVVSTDGKDNASTDWDAARVAALVDDHGIGVVIVASLLADRRALRQFADRNGFFVYGRNLESAQARVGATLAGLVDIRRLTVSLPPTASAITVVLGEARATRRLPELAR